jgi:hypothetical protein
MSDSSRLSASSSLRAPLKLARYATNGWACFAKRKREFDEIARLHREISELSAALDASLESENANQGLREGSTEPAREPEATPKATGCPCGLSDEPWHWPRGGVCAVGASMPVGK